MSTSIIDYIFRELAITYLGRHDLAHVCRRTCGATRSTGDDPDFDEEEIYPSGRWTPRTRRSSGVTAPAVGAPQSPAAPRRPPPSRNEATGTATRTGERQRPRERTNGNGATAVAPARATSTPVAGSREERIRQAHSEGVRGRPVPRVRPVDARPQWGVHEVRHLRRRPAGEPRAGTESGCGSGLGRTTGPACVGKRD